MHISGSSYNQFINTGYDNAARLLHDKREPNVDSSAPQSDRVSISLQARAMAAERMFGSSGHHTLLQGTPGMMAEGARVRVEQLLQELGVPKNTPVEITADSTGNIQVEVDHPDHSKIEKVLTEDAPLRDLILMGQHAAGLARIEKAASLAQDKVPAGDEDALAEAQGWLRKVIRDTNTMPYVTHINGSSARATFEDGNGNVVDYMNNLNPPKFT